MSINSKHRKAALVATGASVVLVLGGAVGVGYAAATSGSSVTQAADGPAAPVFPRNDAGLTYGSELDAQTPDQAPDLIAAIATNGREGYVRRADLYPQLPTSPEEALKAQEAGETGARTIAVYALDGTTVVGDFEVTPGNGKGP